MPNDIWRGGNLPHCSPPPSGPTALLLAQAHTKERNEDVKNFERKQHINDPLTACLPSFPMLLSLPFYLFHLLKFCDMCHVISKETELDHVWGFKIQLLKIALISIYRDEYNEFKWVVSFV